MYIICEHRHSENKSEIILYGYPQNEEEKCNIFFLNLGLINNKTDTKELI